MYALSSRSAHLAKGGDLDSSRPVVIHVSKLVCQPGERRGRRFTTAVEGVSRGRVSPGGWKCEFTPPGSLMPSCNTASAGEATPSPLFAT